jgi:hypothetical protein
MPVPSGDVLYEHRATIRQSSSVAFLPRRLLAPRRRVTERAETVLDIVGAIRARYDLVDDDVAPPPR